MKEEIYRGYKINVWLSKTLISCWYYDTYKNDELFDRGFASSENMAIEFAKKHIDLFN